MQVRDEEEKHRLVDAPVKLLPHYFLPDAPHVHAVAGVCGTGRYDEVFGVLDRRRKEVLDMQPRRLLRGAHEAVYIRSKVPGNDDGQDDVVPAVQDLVDAGRMRQARRVFE
jgi:hypothetical protein